MLEWEPEGLGEGTEEVVELGRLLAGEFCEF